MTRRPTLLLVVLPLVAVPCAIAEPDAEFPVYVGRTVCLECHGLGESAKPCTAETKLKHLKSYEALTKREARHIAMLSGVTEKPTESALCQGCHSTGADVGTRWTAEGFRFEDGVQCESCHEAGSHHAEAYRNATDGQPVGERGAIHGGDRPYCDTCHIERRSHKEVLENLYRVPEADWLYKTPVNLTISPDSKRLYVVCERSNSLIVIDLDEKKIIAEVEVGSRPQDVALGPDGKRAYITNRFTADVSVLDTATLEVVATVPVGHEPHGVLVDPAGKYVYVLNTEQDSISVIDAADLTEAKRLAAGAGPWSMALSPNGKSIYATSVRPNPARFRDPPRSEVTMIRVDRAVVAKRVMADDANMLQGIAFVPDTEIALFTMMRTKNLVPLTRLAQGWTITNGLGVVWPDGRVDQVLLDEPAGHMPDLVDLAVSPDGRYAFVVSGGSDQVAVVDVSDLLDTIRSASDYDRQHVLPNHLGRSDRYVVKKVAVSHNPRAVVFAPDGRTAYVANALDDSVTIIDMDTLAATGKITLGGPTELTEIRWGERLFHSADITFGRQFSCRSCHPDGHINGLTFDIEADGLGLHPVDNRTLRGIVDTAPFKWEGTNPSLSRQCGPRLAVFFTRLAPFTPEELAALVRYEYTIERPPNHHRKKEGLTLTQRRGKALFERRTANNGRPLNPHERCANCHNGAYMTTRLQTQTGTSIWFDAAIDVEPDWLFDASEFGDLGIFYFPDTGMPQKVLDIPHLNSIYNSPPYLHSGAAATLEEIWTRFNMINGHGFSGDWTRQQLNDLIAYLKVL